MIKWTLFNIVEGLLSSFERFKTIFNNENEFRSFFRMFGWNVDILPASYSAIAVSIDNAIIHLENIKSNLDSGMDDVVSLFTDLNGIYQGVKSLSQTPTSIPSADINVFFHDLKNDAIYYIFTKFLIDRYPEIYNAFRLLNVISIEYMPPLGSREEHSRVIVNFDSLKRFIAEPQNILEILLNFNNPYFNISSIEQKVYDFLVSLNLNARLSPASLRSALQLEELSSKTLDVQSELFLPIFSFYDLNDYLQTIGLSFFLSKEIGSGSSSLSIIPRLPSGLVYDYQINDNLTLSFRANTSLTESFLIYLSVTEQFAKYLQNNSTFSILGFGFTLIGNPDNPILIFGTNESTRLQLGGYDIALDLNITNNDLEIVGSINFKDLELIINSSEGDSFLSKIIPSDSKIPIDLSLIYSNKSGFHFSGSGGFEVALNPHLNIGPIGIEDMKFRLFARLDSPGGITIEAIVSIIADLGPLKLTVKNVGIGFNMGFGEGNAGLFDFKLGFTPPTGVGLSIDSGVVTGGGFLNYDEATSAYTGGLELNFSKISFSAIGIISTKLPGNEDGYSLLIIISTEFTPVQLGMGFTLNGIGGILGLHRTMNPDVLRTGIRDNTLDHILFPKDIVKNANTIISNMGQAFPIKKDQFLIGPMAKIGWGTPTLLTIELGIIIELPEPVRLAILGVVKALLPDKDNAILKIQVNFLGIIDFTNKYLSFDASLYDSKILTFGLFGDMALRLYWGDKPNFLLSVGGFHPKFRPPPLNLPELRRLSIVLANSNNLKISVETYIAITSNSVQFGARVAVLAHAWKIQAVGALWFDILFQFRPFYFIADMGVMFAIKMGKKTLLAIFVNQSLEGPDPWRAIGKASFKVLGIRVTVSFDKTFGKARVEAVEAAETKDRLLSALNSADNWEALLPERNSHQVSWRQEQVGANMSLDPAGTIKVVQRVLPLNITMDKFGSAAIKDNKRYHITGITANGNAMPMQTIQDNFARSEFFNMTDEEKLSRDSYELFDSGILAGEVGIRSEYAVHRKCSYEEITIDGGYRQPEPLYALPSSQFDLQVFGSYISASSHSDFDHITTSEGPNRVSVSEVAETFVVMNGNDLSMVAGPFNNSVAAERYLAEQLILAPSIVSQWVVANPYELTGM